MQLQYDEAIGVVNVASVPQRSPFRYAGGKTWLIPQIRKWLTSLPFRLSNLLEPFAGGAIVSVTAVSENLVEKAKLVELDPDVAAVWQAVVDGDGLRLGEQICGFDLNLQNVTHILSSPRIGTYETAFATIVKNRVTRGGILAPGVGLVKNGENNRGLQSRWYPATLRRRFSELHAIRGRLAIEVADGVEAIQRYGNMSNSVIFIDPPYTVAGRRLYRYNELDHHALFDAVANVSADFLMTYDDSATIRGLAAEFEFDTRAIPMKTTHHAQKQELLIGRDLRWISN